MWPGPGDGASKDCDTIPMVSRIHLYGYFAVSMLRPPVMSLAGFDWDPGKDLANQTKHGVSFADAQHAFADPARVIAEDSDAQHECGEALLLFRSAWRRCSDGPLYVPGQSRSNHWRRLLAQRKTNL